MPAKNAPVSALEALRGRFSEVFDVDTVLGYDFAEFFDFCQFLGYYGYNPRGFDGHLQSPRDCVAHQVGNCWDQTELQREWFKRHDYQVKTYLLYYYLSDDNCPSHSILTYVNDRGEWCWFEPMLCGTVVEYSGVHQYASELELLRDFQQIFAQFGQKSGLLPEVLERDKWSLYGYTRPEYGITDSEFYAHCRKEGKKHEIR